MNAAYDIARGRMHPLKQHPEAAARSEEWNQVADDLAHITDRGGRSGDERVVAHSPLDVLARPNEHIGQRRPQKLARCPVQNPGSLRGLRYVVLDVQLQALHHV